MSNCMHLTIPKNTSCDVYVDGKTTCSAPVNSLIKPLAKFQEGGIVDTTDLTFVVVDWEIFSTYSHVARRFCEAVGSNLIQKGQTLKDFWRIWDFLGDVRG